MAEFAYLFRGGDVQRSPQQMQEQMQRWVAWIKDLGAKGFLKNPGQPLERSGKLVNSNKKKSVTDGPYVEKDAVIGFMTVEAKDLEHAVELSSGCPIFASGGLVEVRPVMKMGP